MAETQSNKEYDSFIRINVGTLHSLDPKSVLYASEFVHSGDTESGSGTYYQKYFANGIATAFDEKTVAIDSEHKPRRIEPRGQIRQLEIELGVEAGEVAETNDLRIKEGILYYTVDKKRGE